ncbi:MAG: tetratricopeptide repeat protein [candidate division Zixibacteria bacterium]|nr:tetratricopeptide repeat protein [candidate division Zixibacteria bacterium]
MVPSNIGLRSTAITLIESGNFREAETVLRSLVNENPHDPAMACLLGECCSHLPNFEAAEFWFRKAINLQPYNNAILNNYNKFRIENLLDLPQDRPKYLISPVMSASYSFKNVADCIFFGQGAQPNKSEEIVSSPYDSIDAILYRCPGYFKPEKIICLCPEYYSPPANIEKCDIETIGIYTDIPTQAETIALSVPLFGSCITQGFHDGPQMLLNFGAKRSGTGFFIGDDPLSWVDRNDERDIDILFLSTFSLPIIHKERNEITNTILSLSDKYKVVVGTVDQKTTAELTARAKIVVNCSHSGEFTSEMIARRIFESMSCGALCFTREKVKVVKNFFKDKTEIIYYKNENLKSLLEIYLRSDSERQRIADAGKKKTIENYSYASNVKRIAQMIESGNGYRISSARYRMPRYEAFLRRARLFYHSLQATDYNHVAELLGLALEQEPQLESVICNDLGVLYAEKGEFNKAEEMFKKALQSADTHPVSYVNLVNLYIHALENLDKAISVSEENIPEYPDEWGGTLPLYLVSNYGKLSKVDKFNFSIFYLKIQEAYLQHQDRGDEFKKRIGILIDAEINKSLGFGFEGEGKIGEAIEYYEKALTEFTDDWEMHYRLALLYHNQNNLEKAIEHSRIASNLQPLDIKYVIEYYNCLFESEKYEDILTSTNQMLNTELRITESTTPIKLFRALASAEMKKPDMDKLIANYKTAPELTKAEKSLVNESVLELMTKWSNPQVPG